MTEPTSTSSTEAARLSGVLRSPVGAVTVVAVVVGVLLRFFADSPLWLDEAQSVALADQVPGGLVDALRHDGHPPLFYLLLSAWTAVAGDSAFAVRALSGLLGVLALVLVVLIVRRHSDARTSALVLGVLASSPFAIRYATEARMYALLVVLLMAGHLAMEAAWQRPDGQRLARVAAVVALLLYTHYWSLFLVAVLLGGLLVATATHRVAAAPRLLVGVAVGAVAFIPWLPVFLYQLAHTGTPWAPGPRPTVVAALALEAYGGGRGSEALLVAVCLSLLVALGLGTRGHRSELGPADLPWLWVAVGVGVATMLLGAGVSLITQTAFQGRYGVFCFVPVVLAAGVGLSRLPRPAASLALVLLVGLSWISVARELSRDRTQVGVAAEVVDAQGSDGDLVVFCPDQLAPAGHFLLGDRFTTVAFPAMDDGRSVDWVDYGERNRSADLVAVADAIVARAGGSANVWMIWIDGYRNFERQCGRLHGELSARLGGSRHLVAANGDEYYNAANLNAFGVPPS
ncbi:MAG: hypothetical protein GY882_07235 [Actinomycetia bacterium]|nr:hypothetical protein [Actinomycetes bacterium]